MHQIAAFYMQYSLNFSGEGAQPPPQIPPPTPHPLLSLRRLNSPAFDDELRHLIIPTFNTGYYIDNNNNNIIIIIIRMIMFMMLLSWLSHFESSPGSCDEMERRQMSADPQPRPNYYYYYYYYYVESYMKYI